MKTVHSGYISDGANPGLAGLSGFNPGDRTLRLQTPYMKGDDVRFVQRIVGVTVDGVYGPQTTAGVQQYQNKIGWSVADGSVGPALWEKLQKEKQSPVNKVLQPIQDLLKPAVDILNFKSTGYDGTATVPDPPEKKSKDRLVWYIGAGAVGVSLLGIMIAASGDNK